MSRLIVANYLKMLIVFECGKEKSLNVSANIRFKSNANLKKKTKESQQPSDGQHKSHIFNNAKSVRLRCAKTAQKACTNNCTSVKSIKFMLKVFYWNIVFFVAVGSFFFFFCWYFHSFAGVIVAINTLKTFA